MPGPERGHGKQSVAVDHAVVGDFAADLLAQAGAVCRKPTGQCGDRLLLGQENGGIGILEVPAAQIHKVGQSVRMVAVHMGDEDGSCGRHGDPRRAHPVDCHHAHIDKIPHGVLTCAQGNHGTRALPMCFRHAMACA